MTKLLQSLEATVVDKGKVRRPIGAKIFGATIVLLLMMAAVTWSATVNLHQLSRQLTALSEYYIPLEQTVGEIRASHMSQILMFERFLGEGEPERFAALQAEAQRYAGELLPCDRDTLRAVSRKVREDFPAGPERAAVTYAVQRLCSDDSARQAMALVTTALADPSVAADPAQVQNLSKVQAQLEFIARGRTALHETIERFLAQHDQLDAGARAILKEQLETNRNNVSREAGTLSRLLQGHTVDAARRAQAVERDTLVFNWTATLVAVLLGLAFTLILTRSLVRPIRELLSGAKAVEDGDLDIRVNVHSTDELALLAQSFNFMVSGLKEKEAIKSTFGKYIDPRIVQTLIDEQAAGRVGEKRPMTVYFSDIEGFTAICEELTPDGVVRLLNGYLAEMSEPVLANRGIIDKYIGDSIMAFWGPPFVGEDEHALLACEVALEQLARLQGFRARLPDLTGLRRGLPRFNLRVGIATGEVTAGSIGSDTARSYTVIGDTVNLASRLEAINKEYGTRIILDEHAWSAVRAKMETRELDRIRVAGKAEAARVFELLGRRGEVDATRLQLRNDFELALAAYRQQQWDEAAAGFEACVALADDPASALFLRRIAHLRAQDPGPRWDGVWQFVSK
ncbi:adenylate/guanylate cyclase domain-containing protein [Arenimonas composti]|uniref:HAMP domain-containing protein n=1 Tax=Arenimonas composti TR7-09 = DSM 18010 TaxID=1121013 RepID=A0A091B8R1_9GAMM|nr:adenylate/guanylate cyclase domain-containing protein [Arenimonas composti]KFN49013.1 hypothetical protein P873_12775 [Arenimonas composti TR7-09 = DSM 18010]